jgi:hypothetical protein
MKKLKAGAAVKGSMEGAIGELSGAAVSESEYQRLKAVQEGASAKEDVLKKLKEKSLKELSGAAVTENERKRLDNIISKKAKGGEIVIGKGRDYIKDLL